MGGYVIHHPPFFNTFQGRHDEEAIRIDSLYISIHGNAPWHFDRYTQDSSSDRHEMALGALERQRLATRRITMFLPTYLQRVLFWLLDTLGIE
jgi:hypothetical protein